MDNKEYTMPRLSSDQGSSQSEERIGINKTFRPLSHKLSNRVHILVFHLMDMIRASIHSCRAADVSGDRSADTCCYPI